MPRTLFPDEFFLTASNEKPSLSNLDHLGSEVREYHRAVAAGQEPGHVDYSFSGERVQHLRLLLLGIKPKRRRNGLNGDDEVNAVPVRAQDSSMGRW